MMEYSAGLTSQLFWLQEARKTASLMEEGKEKVNIREIVWTENIYQVRAEYRAIEVLNNTWRRISLLPKNVRKLFVNCDIETAKVINLISIMFMHDVFSEKIRLGEKEITDRDLNVFFADKAMQSEVVAGWTETATKKLKQGISRILFEAGLLESSKKTLCYAKDSCELQSRGPFAGKWIGRIPECNYRRIRYAAISVR